MDNATRVNPRLALEQALGTRFIDGNTLEILRNGDEIFPAMLESVAAATQCIDFVTYVYWTGDIARRMATALAQRADAGVRVRVLLDSFGAKSMDSQLIDSMETAGVELRWFRPLSTWRMWRSDKRTHRKLLICDSAIGFTGGVGIAEEWEGDARNPDEWRDTHVALRGPALTRLRAAFLDNWNEAGGWTFEQTASEPAPQPDGVPVQVVRAATTVGWTDTATMFRGLVAIAQQCIRIVTAYFCPDPKLVELLIAARRRGVDIQILVPGQYCDSRLSQLAGHQHIERLLKNDIAVWRYQRTMLHAKITVVDSNFICIGSANLNHRSEGKDEECSIVAMSRSTAQTLERQFEEDLEQSERYLLREWTSRSKWLLAKEWLARRIINQL